jgi:hypothetical protein
MMGRYEERLRRAVVVGASTLRVVRGAAATSSRAVSPPAYSSRGIMQATSIKGQ